MKTVADWNKWTDSYAMTSVVPYRSERTATDFRFATAGVLRLVPRAVGGTGLAFLAGISDRLEGSRAVWTPQQWRQFSWWCRVGQIPPPANLPQEADREELLRIVCARGRPGFQRLLDSVHFMMVLAWGTGKDLDREQDAFDRGAVRVVREVFGSPHAIGSNRTGLGYKWHPRRLPAAWLTATVVSLARQIWDANDFAAMPILADALQDAGCDRADVLSHCREADCGHSRGCWVLDAILG